MELMRLIKIIHSKSDVPKLIADFKESGERHGVEDSDFPMDIDAFTEIYPEDKFSIVKKLQRTWHITGMTVDGVNDAPALRQPEVGIAVSSATDYVSPSQKPETWKIGGYVFMAAGHYHFGLCNGILSFFE